MERVPREPDAALVDDLLPVVRSVTETTPPLPREIGIGLPAKSPIRNSSPEIASTGSMSAHSGSSIAGGSDPRSHPVSLPILGPIPTVLSADRRRRTATVPTKRSRPYQGGMKGLAFHGNLLPRERDGSRPLRLDLSVRSISLPPRGRVSFVTNRLVSHDSHS
jgi:hypothetical protein